MSQRKPQSRRQKPAEMPETENDRIAGRNPVMEALRSGARIDMLYVGQESGGLQEIISLAKEQGIPVKVVTESKLTQLTGGAVHQGVAAEGACGTYVSLEELLQKADLVSLHCPLTESTHHMINKDTIVMMRDSAILVNTSRGGLIDTDALIEALRARKFGGVGLDVYEDEDDQVFQDFSDDVLENEVVPVLLSFPNVVITSHQAFFTRTALQSIAAITLENARAFARGEELKNEVKA